MNTADVAFLATDGLGLIAAGWDVTRRRITANANSGAPADAAATQPLPVAPHPPMTPVTVPVPARLSALPADRAAREAVFGEARAEGKTVAEARAAAGIAERTARTYEARRVAALDGAAR